MAAQSPLSLVTDPAKINPVGASQTDLEEYQKSLDAQIKALEQRYAQPNWFNVAAGFAKPQLGGFLASLGSASQSLGETEERRREAELPIAQMRTQLAQSKILTGANKTQADEYEKWRSSGKPMDQATFTRLFSLNPQTPVAEAVKAAYEGQRKDLEYTSAQQRLMMDAIAMKQARGMKLSKQEMDFLENLPGQLSLRQEAQPLLPGGKPTGAEGPAATPSTAGATSNAPVGMFDLSAPGALDNVRKGIANITDPIERARATQALESQLNPGRPTPAAKEAKITPYAPTFTYPETAGLDDKQRASLVDAYNRNTETEEKESRAIVNQWAPLATDTNYSAVKSEYESAINLIKEHKDVAKKVFNLMREDGSVLNQIANAAQEGMGVNIGSMVATVNVPVNAFKSAGLNREQQMVADRLVRSFLIVGNAKLMAQGMAPEKGQATYTQFLEGTKASLKQNASTALHNLEKDYLQFQYNKKLYDQVKKEHDVQSKVSVTPYTDILRKSPYVQDLRSEAEERNSITEKNYREAIKRAKEARNKTSGKE